LSGTSLKDSNISRHAIVSEIEARDISKNLFLSLGDILPLPSDRLSIALVSARYDEYYSKYCGGEREILSKGKETIF
jgi:hypothetical protein